MKPYLSLAWKEWHEARAFLWIALGVFLGLPLVGGIERTIEFSHRLEIDALPVVVMFGGVLAIFVAVGATCRDFNGSLEDFWRSRPIGVARWLLTKYLVGLAVVLVGCSLPILVQSAVNRDRNLFILLWFPFLWFALYSIGFLSGCLIRQTGQAATLALAATLLLYLLPLIIPPLKMLSFDPEQNTIDIERVWLNLTILLLLIAAVSLFVAVVAVQRHWRINSSRKTLSVCIGCAFLLLVCTVAFQLGTNLPIIAQIQIPDNEFVEGYYGNGNHGFLITDQPRPPANRSDSWRQDLLIHTVDLSGSSIKIGPGVFAQQNMGYLIGYWNNIDAPQHPEIQYYLIPLYTENNQVSYSLHLINLVRNTNLQIRRLWEENETEFTRQPSLFIWTNRLYVIGSRLVTFDITQAGKPKLLSDVLFQPETAQPEIDPVYRSSNEWVFHLLPLPGLPNDARIAATVRHDFRNDQCTFDGNLLCYQGDAESLQLYRLEQLTNTDAVFEKIAEHQSLLIERIFGSPNRQKLSEQNGLLFVRDDPSAGYFDGTGNRRHFINARVTVLDLAGPNPFRVVGHFAAPSNSRWLCYPLADGRTLVGRNTLYLVGPPPGYEQK